MASRAERLIQMGEMIAKGNKAKEADEARFYLEWGLRSNPSEPLQRRAWYALSVIAGTPQEQHTYLSQILASDPAHLLAKRDLARLKLAEKNQPEFDPNLFFQSVTTTPHQTNSKQIDCRQCNARMVYTSDGTRLYCEHCGLDENLPQTDIAGTVQTEHEQDFLMTLATTKGHSTPQTSQTFDCNQCGHSFLLRGEALSVTCPYCHHLYVVKELNYKTRQLIAPQAIIPFQIDGISVQKTVRHWLAKRKIPAFAEPTSFYMPAFTFDIGGSVENRSQQVVWVQNNTTSPPQSIRTIKFHTNHYPVYFDDILVPAFDQPSPLLLKALADYDLGKLLPYDPRYLAGIPAEINNISVASASLQARKIAWEQSKKQLNINKTNSTGASSAGIIVTSYKLVLLPIWMAHYRLGDKEYEFVINGQSGKLWGELPPKPQDGGLLRKFTNWLEQ